MSNMNLRMGGKRRDFSEQFRIDAVKRMITEGPGTETNATYVSIAKDLQIYDTSLHEWRRKYEPEARRQLAAEAAEAEPTDELEEQEEEEVKLQSAVELLQELQHSADDVSTVEIALGLPTFILPLTKTQMDRLLERVRVQLEETFGPSDDEQ